MLFESQICFYLLAVTRIAALLTCAPALSSRAAPLRFRFLLAMVLCTCLAPLLPEDTGQGAFDGNFARLLAQEVAIGLSLALAPALLLWGLQLGLQAVEQMVGMPGQTNPSDALAGGAAGALARFVQLLALLLFLLIGGHRQVIEAVLDTFRWLPPGSQQELTNTPQLLADLLAQSFWFGVRAVAPIAVAVLVSTLGIAAASRSLPQLSHFAVGANVNLVVMMTAVWLSLGAFGWLFQEQVTSMVRSVLVAWETMASG